MFPELHRPFIQAGGKHVAVVELSRWHVITWIQRVDRLSSKYAICRRKRGGGQENPESFREKQDKHVVFSDS